MIITRLRGGLGNQMFQYAFGRTMALRQGAPLLLDVSHYSTAGARRFELDAFAISSDAIIRSRFASRLKKFTGGCRTITNLFFYDPVAAGASGSLYLDGFWESYKYFTEAESQIRQDFTLKRPSARFLELSRQIPKGSVSVHIRRGDFLSPSGNARVLNGKEYIERAIAAVIAARGTRPESVTIFSDDCDWCRKELSTIAGIPAHIFDDPGISTAEELILMSLHSDNIISNSTFSWWAAFLNRNPDKIVVSPAGWFTDPKINTHYVADILPHGWKMA